MLCYIYEDHSGYLTRGRHCLPVTSTWLHPRVLMGFMGSPPGFYGIHLFSFLYCVCFCFVCIRSLSCEPGARVAQWVRSLDLTTHTSLSPIRRGFMPCFVNYKKGCTRLAAASDKVYQLLAHSRWFSPGTLASSTTKTGRHDIDEKLLKVALKHLKSKSNHLVNPNCHFLWDCPFLINPSIFSNVNLYRFVIGWQCNTSLIKYILTSL